MSNVTPPHKRLKILQMLIDGWSVREVAHRVKCVHQTVLRYAHAIELRRDRGHRSPTTYRHANQCGEWFQTHEKYQQRYNEAKAMELLALIAAESLAPPNAHPRPIDADALAYRQGKALLAQCQRILNKRTYRQRHNANQP